MHRQIIAFIKLGRFLFLAGGFLFYGLGAAIARHQGIVLDWQLYVWGQFIVTSTQLMVHYSNDYFDYAADLANPTPTLWSGGSRILPRGELGPKVALCAGLGLLAVAISATLALELIKQPGPLALPLLLAAIVLSWGYSAPPLRLHARGLGELTVTLVVPTLTPLVSFYLQAEKIALLAILASVPLALLQFNMILSVHLPDVEGDTTTSKHTLVVRLGRPLTARLYTGILVVAYLLLPVLVVAGLPARVALMATGPLPLAVWLIRRMRQRHWEHPRHWNSLAFSSIALLMTTAALETAAFLLFG
jgi:1,4-dihydroxy-2-naphthoate octaprenyltransferase